MNLLVKGILGVVSLLLLWGCASTNSTGTYQSQNASPTVNPAMYQNNQSSGSDAAHRMIKPAM